MTTHRRSGPATDRPLRVAYLLTQDRGGPVDVTVALVAALSQRSDVQVRLFAPEPARNRDRIEQVWSPVQVQGKGSAHQIAGTRRQIMQWQPDVVHAQDRRSGLVCTGLGRANRLRQRPAPVLVHTYHGVPDDVSQDWLDDPSAPGPSRYTRTVLAADAAVARTMDRTVVVADMLRGFLVDRLHVPQHRVQHIDNGLELPEIAPTSIRRSDRHSKHHGTGRDTPLRLLFVGMLIPRKGVDVLLRALTQTPESVQLSVVGDGPEREALEALSAELGLEHRVSFLGFRQDIPQVMAQHDVFVLPARMEQQPLVIIEALGAGMAVIATDVGGVRDMLAEHGTVVAADDVEALAEAITGSLETEASGDQATKRSAYAHERFGIDTCVRRHLELYTRLLEG